MNSNLQRREKRAQNEILMQSVVWKIIMELYYGTIKPKEYRQYRTERKMDVLDQIFHILISADLLPSINLAQSLLYFSAVFCAQNSLNFIIEQSNCNSDDVLRCTYLSFNVNILLNTCAHLRKYMRIVYSLCCSDTR